MLRVSHLLLCGALFSVIGSSMACNLTLDSYPPLNILGGSPVGCLVRDILCLLQPLVSEVRNLVGLVLITVYFLLQLLAAIGLNVTSFLNAVIRALLQAARNSSLRSFLLNVLLTVLTVLGTIIPAVGDLLP